MGACDLGAGECSGQSSAGQWSLQCLTAMAETSLQLNDGLCVEITRVS